MKAFVVLATIALFPSLAHAEGCADALGTFLTVKTDTSGADVGAKGRTLLSLSPSGMAIMTDSAQGGVKGYQAFGMMQGTWQCDKGAGSIVALQATLFDFSYPDEANPDASTARVELAGTFDTEANALKGIATVKIFPLMEQPVADTTPKTVVTYDFTGTRLLAQTPVAQ